MMRFKDFITEAIQQGAGREILGNVALPDSGNQQFPGQFVLPSGATMWKGNTKKNVKSIPAGQYNTRTYDEIGGAAYWLTPLDPARADEKYYIENREYRMIMQQLQAAQTQAQPQKQSFFNRMMGRRA